MPPRKGKKTNPPEDFEPLEVLSEINFSKFSEEVANALSALSLRQANFVIEYCDTFSDTFHDPVLSLVACGVDAIYARQISREYMRDSKVSAAIAILDNELSRSFEDDDIKGRLAAMLLEDRKFARLHGNASASANATKTLCQLYGQLSDNVNLKTPETPKRVQVEFVESAIKDD